MNRSCSLPRNIKMPHHLREAESELWSENIILDDSSDLRYLIEAEIERYCPTQCARDAFFKELGNLNVTYKAFDDMPVLNFAVMKQARKCIEVLLDFNCDVNITGLNGTSPLHLAVQTGDLDIVTFLLESGADIDLCTYSGKSALHYAADVEDEDIIRTLVQAGCVVNQADLQGNAPIHHAAEKGNEACVDLLLNLGARIDHKDKDGDTSLHYSASRGNMGLMTLLLDRGAEIQSTNRVGRTPLHMAAYYGRADAMRYLLQHGAVVNAKDIRGQTPLHRAAVDGATDCMDILLKNGATVMDQDLVDGCTPLHLAAGNNAATCCHLLIQRGASVNHPVDIDGNTPIHSAIVPYGPSAGFDCAETLMLLLRFGADVEAVNLHGETPLWWSVLGEHNQALKILLQVNCNTNHMLIGDTIRQKWRLSWPGASDAMCHVLKYTIWRKDWNAALCLLVAGCSPQVLIQETDCKIALLNGLKCMDQECRWTEYVQQLCSEPLSLQITSRNAIRDALGRGRCLQDTIQSLPLPENMLTYLSLQELLDIDF